jgi:hypothetical protein
MKRRWLTLLTASMLGFACATYNKGELVAAGAEDLPIEMTMVREDAMGRSCGNVLVQRLERAVEDALRKSPGSNALVDASFHFERLCLVVRGKAVRVP